MCLPWSVTTNQLFTFPCILFSFMSHSVFGKLLLRNHAYAVHKKTCQISQRYSHLLTYLHNQCDSVSSVLPFAFVEFV